MIITLSGLANDTDSIRIDNLKYETKKLKDSVDSIRKDINIIKAGAEQKTCECKPQPHEVNNCGEWFIILSPFLLFIIFLASSLWLTNGFKLTDALTENESSKKVIKNPEYIASIIAVNANIPNISLLFPPTIEVSATWPDINDLKDIAAKKDDAAVLIKTTLDKANNSKSSLDAAATAAQNALDAANAANPQVPAIIATATQNLSDTKKAAAENDDVIKTHTDLLPKAEAEAEAAKKNLSLAEATVQNIAGTSTSAYRPSISRYIAFMTSFIIIILVVCMSSFFIYHYISTGCPPDFGALTVMLIALGLGVTPYITNKVSTAATANKS